MPPIKEVGWAVRQEPAFPVAHAPKIMRELSAIKWDKWSPETIIQYHNGLGDLWDDTTYGRCTANLPARKRTVYHKVEIVKDPPMIISDLHNGPGSPVLSTVNGKPQFLLSTIEPTTFIRPISCTIEGKSGGNGYQSLLALLMKKKKNSAREAAVSEAG